MDIHVKIRLFPYFNRQVLYNDFIIHTYLARIAVSNSNWWTKLQIMPHTEYLIPTDIIYVFLLHSNLMNTSMDIRPSYLIDVFSIRFKRKFGSGLLFLDYFRVGHGLNPSIDW